MKFTKGKIEEVETYRGYTIVIKHDMNIFEKIKRYDYPIYTICDTGWCQQGTIEDVRKFIDYMLEKWGTV